MSNLNHTNDKNKAPQCNFIKNGNPFKNEMHYLKNMSRLLELTYEGFYLARNYSKADLKVHLQGEGQCQMDFYIKLFDGALLALGAFLDDMKASCDISLEDK